MIHGALRTAHARTLSMPGRIFRAFFDDLTSFFIRLLLQEVDYREPSPESFRAVSEILDELHRLVQKSVLL